MSCCEHKYQNQEQEGLEPAKLEPKSRYQQRLDACLRCANLDMHHQTAISTFDRCLVCGCFVKAKAALPMAHCPIGEW